jgi:hypothetical protein
MNFAIPDCPTCGAIAKGTIETIPGLALLTFDADGDAEYFGETEVCWNGQEAKITGDAFTLACAEGHEWQSPLGDAEPDKVEPDLIVPNTVRPAAAGTTRSFWFHTESEANAFIEGVNYVNDSALEVGDMVQEREEGEANAWRVDMKDADAQEPLDYTDPQSAARA